MNTRDYPDDWESRRHRVYRRSGHRCDQCGRSGGPNRGRELHSHHIVPMRDGGGHELSNLVALCEACHRAEHTAREPPTDLGERADTLRQQIAETDNSLGAHASIGGDYLEGVATLMDSMSLFFQTGKAGALVQHMRKEAEMSSNWRRQTIDTKTHLNLLLEAYADPEFELEPAQRDLILYIRAGKSAMRQTVKMLEMMGSLRDALIGVCKCSDCESRKLTENITCAECGHGSVVAIADSEEMKNALNEMSELMNDVRDLVSKISANEQYGASVDFTCS